MVQVQVYQLQVFGYGWLVCGFGQVDQDVWQVEYCGYLCYYEYDVEGFDLVVVLYVFVLVVGVDGCLLLQQSYFMGGCCV